MIRLLHNGFQVWLIDEFKTSSLYSHCMFSKLETFRITINWRLFKRKDKPTIKCHGLLRRTNQKIFECRDSLA
ncbi:MAG: hypothetical protein EXX96DRAFT_532044 [Benjaminiella poitrasii]|nr:MAG: hypothetical protein EXX96DRAFT_532044 [Benjaminiella poitrasii]